VSAKFGTRALLGRTLRLLRADGVPALASWLLLAAGATAIDTIGPGASRNGGATLFLSVATIGFQYWATRAALRQVGAVPTQAGRFGPFFLLGIVSSLAYFLGFALLVVPGILLVVRWWMAVPILLDSNAGVFESLKESWRGTKGGFWPIFRLLVAIWSPVVLASVAFGPVFAEGQTGIVGPLALNLALYASLVAGWYAAVATYSVSEGRRDSLNDVFA
jgi:hypothetical protein